MPKTVGKPLSKKVKTGKAKLMRGGCNNKCDFEDTQGFFSFDKTDENSVASIFKCINEIIASNKLPADILACPDDLERIVLFSALLTNLKTGQAGRYEYICANLNPPKNTGTLGDNKLICAENDKYYDFKKYYDILVKLNFWIAKDDSYEINREVVHKSSSKYYETLATIVKTGKFSNSSKKFSEPVRQKILDYYISNSLCDEDDDTPRIQIMKQGIDEGQSTTLDKMINEELNQFLGCLGINMDCIKKDKDMLLSEFCKDATTLFKKEIKRLEYQAEKSGAILSNISNELDAKVDFIDNFKHSCNLDSVETYIKNLYTFVILEFNQRYENITKTGISEDERIKNINSFADFFGTDTSKQEDNEFKKAMSSSKSNDDYLKIVLKLLKNIENKVIAAEDAEMYKRQNEIRATAYLGRKRTRQKGGEGITWENLLGMVSGVVGLIISILSVPTGIALGLGIFAGATFILFGIYKIIMYFTPTIQEQMLKPVPSLNISGITGFATPGQVTEYTAKNAKLASEFLAAVALRLANSKKGGKKIKTTMKRKSPAKKISNQKVTGNKPASLRKSPANKKRNSKPKTSV